MKKKISLFMLCGCILLGLCGCSSNTDISLNENTDISLNEKEQRIYEFIIDTNFYNPSEVRVTTVTDWGFKVSAFNRVGGSIVKCFDTISSKYSISEDTCNSLYENKSSDKEVSVKNINNKLKAHWEELGY